MFEELSQEQIEVMDQFVSDKVGMKKIKTGS